jgi:hypothetical protein
LLSTRPEKMVVGSKEAPFIGVSGRQIAIIEYGTEVAKLGEHGPYSIIHWSGRDGYVLGDLLVRPEDFDTAAAEAEAAFALGSVHGQENTRKRLRFISSWLQRAA